MWYAIHVNLIFSVFFGLMFNLKGPQGQNPRTTCGPRTTVWETLSYFIHPGIRYFTSQLPCHYHFWSNGYHASGFNQNRAFPFGFKAFFNPQPTHISTQVYQWRFFGYSECMCSGRPPEMCIHNTRLPALQLRHPSIDGPPTHAVIAVVNCHSLVNFQSKVNKYV